MESTTLFHLKKNTSEFDKDCLNLSIKGLQIHFLKGIKYA